MKLGIVVSLAEGPEACVEKVARLGLPTCQVGVPADLELGAGLADRLARAAGQHRVEITSVWTHCRCGQVWDFLQGPLTIGLVPEDTRAQGVARLKQGSDFAAVLGVGSVTTHAGFIPENPTDPAYPGVVEALREVAAHCGRHGQWLCLETGQETPVTLLRVIEDVGRHNLGINLDPANLLMYGKANPVDALDVIGRYVRGVHAKDGEYPTNGRQLGLERPLGEGRVGWAALIAKLKALGYDGALTIEREVRGPEQAAGIEQAKKLLGGLL